MVWIKNTFGGRNGRIFPYPAHAREHLPKEAFAYLCTFRSPSSTSKPWARGCTATTTGRTWHDHKG